MTTEGELHVVFGAGPLGKWTARELLRQGKRVRMITRCGVVDDPPEGAELVKADAYDVRQTRPLVEGATSVYQCAQPSYHAWAQQFPPLQAAILQVVGEAGAKLIVAENLYAYGRPYGAPLTEETTYRAHTRKGRVRLAMTEALAEARRAGKARIAIARGSDFFGPDDTVSRRLTFAPALAGKPVYMLGRLDQPHTFTYAPDFGRALAILGAHNEALGQIWHVPSNPPVTQARFAELLGQAIGKPVRAMSTSAPILWLAGLRDPDARELIEMLYEWDRPFEMASDKFQRTFGMAPTPLAEAIRLTAEWVKAHPAGGRRATQPAAARVR